MTNPRVTNPRVTNPHVTNPRVTNPHWTRKEDEYLVAAIAERQTRAQMAKVLVGRSRSAISARVERLRRLGKLDSHPVFTDPAFTEAWEAGMSVSQLAAMFKIKIHQVNRVAQRLGLSREVSAKLRGYTEIHPDRTEAGAAPLPAFHPLAMQVLGVRQDLPTP